MHVEVKVLLGSPEIGLYRLIVTMYDRSTAWNKSAGTIF